MLKNDDWGDRMSDVIERIIKIEYADTLTFIEIQKKEIARLKALEERKRAGKSIRKKPIIESLQRSGILDENGQLAAPYRCDE